MVVLASTIMVMAAKTLHARLQVARKAKELSTRELDARAGLAPGHVWQIESGRKAGIEVETASRLADALDVTLDWLVRGLGDGPSSRPSKPPPSKRTGTEG